MKTFIGGVILCGIILMGASAPCAHAAPNDFPASWNETAAAPRLRSTSNLNARPSAEKAHNDAYPQGKNAFQADDTASTSAPTPPKRAICIGQDCTCGSSSSR